MTPAEHQPLTVVINAVRALTLGPAATALLDESAGHYVTRSLLWAAAILR
jgi:ABC-2 type transport system permease protein